MAAEMTQEELDRLAQEEADQLLAQHQTRITLTPEELARLEVEKKTLLSRVGMNADPDNGPRARRLASRGQGGAEAEPYEPQALPSRHTPTQPIRHNPPAEFVPVPAEVLAPRGDVDLERVDPMQLAELADAAKAAKKTYLSLAAAADEARASYEAAQARFMAYLQQ